ncbi:hypothetical protein LSH36_1264g00011 [Paralvinella palmiformis]|uniref:Uncharacterized protein n=1 Tax=Paralvinella palmiformis TaxID=53620 RepID=A0AAD9IUD6_9ANNE|nr:hypothetical protein LSH36_1264g00011 [Paralvinella palmiformis]
MKMTLNNGGELLAILLRIPTDIVLVIYVFSLVLFLMANFIIGMMLSNMKLKIPNILERTMKVKLRESIVAQRSFGVGYGESESWDLLQTQGCLSPLTRWLTGYISKITTLMFGSICVQAVNLLHLSWQGYQRQNGLSWR